jgi:hypothetical protein
MGFSLLPGPYYGAVGAAKRNRAAQRSKPDTELVTFAESCRGTPD